MATAIIFGTKYGTTKKCAKLLADKLLGKVELINLIDLDSEQIILDGYDTIVIGGSIHRGGIQEEVKNFCNKYIEVLLTKRIGLFVCNLGGDKGADLYIKSSFPKVLIDYSIVSSSFGGELILDNMDGVDEKIMRSRYKDNISLILYDNIDAFSQKLQS